MKAIEFNNKPCKKGCNCIDIAEEKNNGNPVKSYPCLEIDSDGAKEVKHNGDWGACVALADLYKK